MSTTQQNAPLDSAQRGHGPYFWRFNLFHRWIHALAMLTFYVLILTGIPLAFSCAPFAGPLMDFWGGVVNAGRIHRTAAVIMVAYTAAHIAYVTTAIIRARNRRKFFVGPDTLVPGLQDGKDFIQMWKYFFGRAERPRFGRYGYLEKMDYFGEIWGFIVIGGSGFLLWYPEFFGRLLPGWLFNVATVFHMYEAMIASAFLFTIHFFNVHLRPDKFPLDAVMFTGRGTKEYLIEEHPAMEAELTQAERLPVSEISVHDRLAPPPSHRQTLISVIGGFIAWGIGLFTIGMILWAALC